MTFQKQIQKDIADVFLNAEEFGKTCHVKYWHRGDLRDPDEMDIQIVTETDGNVVSIWSKNKAQQVAGNDPTLYQMDKVIYAAEDEFPHLPKKNRNMQIDSKKYNVLAVNKSFKMLEIKLRRLDE